MLEVLPPCWRAFPEWHSGAEVALYQPNGSVGNGRRFSAMNNTKKQAVQQPWSDRSRWRPAAPTLAASQPASTAWQSKPPVGGDAHTLAVLDHHACIRMQAAEGGPCRWQPQERNRPVGAGQRWRTMNACSTGGAAAVPTEQHGRRPLLYPGRIRAGNDPLESKRAETRLPPPPPSAAALAAPRR